MAQAGGKKPEKLLKRILELSTNEGDIVLDFFAGTGTTGAVAHKMNRRYILCEQMDYIDSMTIARLNHVINGEEGGVSESLRWKGGGSFVYCALMERNEVMMSALQYSNTKEEALELLNQTMNHGLLKHSVIPNELRENMETISDMPIEQIKRFVKDLLDYNKLYVNLCDIDDEEMNVKPEDKAFTKSFYGIE